jgi:hypothetical protein
MKTRFCFINDVGHIIHMPQDSGRIQPITYLIYLS